MSKLNLTDEELESMRDAFAIAALAGLLASPDDSPAAPDAKRFAEAAYRYADAMMEARKR